MTAKPGQLPTSVTRTATTELQKLLASGGSVQLLDKSGTVIGTLNADGSATLVSGATLSQVSSLRVNTPGSEAKTFTLGRSLDKTGAIKLQWTQPNGKVVSLPLPAIVNRQAEQKAKSGDAAQKTDDKKADEKKPAPKTDTEDADDDGKGKPANTGKPDNAGKPVNPGKPENPGKGRK